MLIFFLFLHENIYCGYSLEAPHWGTSNEYQQHMFLWRNKKNIMWILPFICSYECPPIRVMSSLPSHTFPGQAKSSKWLTNICAHSFARNRQLAFLNQQKGENDHRKYFMIMCIRLSHQGRHSHSTHLYNIVTWWDKEVNNLYLLNFAMGDNLIASLQYW